MKMKRVIALMIVTNLAATGSAWAQADTVYPADHSASMPAAPPAVDQVPLDQAPQQEQPTLSRFQHALSPHGRWVQTAEYGTVWVPYAANDPSWRPYTNGRWAYTEQGWTFVSFDPWGWAPFHYGRWVYASHGWSWIPGYRWAPAWVSWRYGGGYMAWAPLGPMGVSLAYYNTPSLWSAVHGSRFYSPLHRSYFIPTVRIGGVFARTRFYGVPRVGVYHSPPASYVSRVARVNITRVSSRVVAPRWVGRGVYRPHVRLQQAHRGGTVVATPRGTWRGGTYRPNTYRPHTSYRGPAVRPGYRGPATRLYPRRPAWPGRPSVRPAPRHTPSFRPGSTARPIRASFRTARPSSTSTFAKKR
jgi:hypothetical protein